MSKPRRKRYKYDILLPSGSVHLVRIEGYSPEEACKALQGKIAGKPLRNTDISSTVVANVWSDPSDEGAQWLVTPVSQSDQPAAKLMTWNGKAISTHDVMEILESAFPDSCK